MKKLKAILLLSITFIAFSCSKKDDQGNSNEVPESNRPSMFTITDDGGTVRNYEITYTDFNKLAIIRISFDDRAFVQTFSYDEQNKLIDYDNGNGTMINISYGADGKLSAYTSTMFNAEITETTNGFETLTDGRFNTNYIFNTIGQLIRIEDTFSADIDFNVENESPGAFKNIEMDKILFALPSFSEIYFNKQAFLDIRNFQGEPILNFSNTFNDNGFLKKSIVYVTDISNPKMTIEYFY